ncbi:MAG: serine protease [Mycobacteriales bacterium]
MRSRLLSLATVPVAAAIAVFAIFGLVGAANAAPAWAPAATAAVHPGVMTYTSGAQCTANFVFTDGTNVYIGQAAHCSGTGAATDTNGCNSHSLPLGTAVQVRGATKPGTLVYNSWLTMQKLHETNANVCQYNDLALVKLNAADIGRTNPSVPFWGGPTGINTTGTNTGDTVLSYGNSSLRAGVTALSPKQGVSLGTDSGGWNHPVYTVTPGIPGDSGSAFLDRQGRALGVLSTLQIAPLVAANGVGDFNHEYAYMRAHYNGAISLALGTVSFRGPLA